jgi:hypothetical protein
MKTILLFTSFSTYIYVVLVYLLIPFPLSFAQDDKQEKQVLPWEIEQLDEFPDDEYVPVQKEKQQRSAAYRFSSSDFFAV